ncbi:endonuclease 8-like 3 [Ruditapes philippinarum]|uniref:endonuclease 8-like 3 n=1 Tax=Ruditapes philippinarum TaxID=129788 RepID=UPI00295B3F36|nr:endonuclease 8-like 3 [Ruditapes philippinarum]
MVEGPGCKLKGLKIKGRLKGQTVVNVKGNATEKYKKKGTDGLSPFHQLIGRSLDGVQTLGKELFMYFGDLCLRVHFLMAGQSFINNEKVDNDLGGNADTASLELQMSKDLVLFKKSSVDIRSSEACKQKYDELNDLDICSPVFNFPRAVALVKEQQDRLVCDVLLDQLILPGVGNIIKNEALFDSGIKPSSKISELKDEHVSHLIKMTRDFTNIFYQCRRDGKPLHVHYKIYGKKRCKQCEGKVTICRLGNDNDRVTYFCEGCQTNDLKNKTRKLPMKGSLLGWVKTGNEATTTTTTVIADWSCDSCTFINKSTSTACSICLTPKHKPPSLSVAHIEESDDCMILEENCEPVTSVNANRKKRLSTGNLDVEQPFKTRKLEQNSVDENNSRSKVTKDQSKSSLHAKTHIGLRDKLNQSNGTGQVKSESNSQSQPVSHKSNSDRISSCKTHKRKCSMKEVRKKGDNLGRWFFSCPVRTCNYFEWADEKFPLCPGHGKPCTIRIVMKIGPNNGRKFFACKMPKNKQCKFFEWAEGFD